MARTAAQLLTEFQSVSGQGVFKHITRSDVVNGLKARLRHPASLDQGSSSLCGPATLIYALIRHKPAVYVKYVTDLYRTGVGEIGKLKVEPGSDCRSYKVPTAKIHPVDWIALASLRDSENDFFDYGSVDAKTGGITMPGDLTEWFKKAGFSTIKNVTNVYANKDKGVVKKASLLYLQNYNVALFINAQVLSNKTMKKSSTFPNHWITLTSPVTITRNGNIDLSVYTWGSKSHKVPGNNPSSSPPEADFYDDFYGYVAAK